MSFLSPLLLAGVLGAAVPLVIHLIGRRRAPRLRFAAVDFLLRSNRRLARRLRLRQWLLLALRMALVASIAVMMAKPFTETASDLPAAGTRAQSAVIIVDDTLSMSRQVDGQPLFERARARARQLVQMLGAGADVAVIGLTDPSRPLPALTRQRRRVSAAVDTLGVGAAHARAGPAVNWAARILGDTSVKERHIFVVTDGAAHGWARGTPPRSVAGIPVHVVDVASKSAGNAAVVDLRSGASAAPGRRSSRITARVCNHDPAKLERRITLTVDRQVVARGVVRAGARACATKAFEHTFDRGGLHIAVVALERDALPADDRRFLRLELESSDRALLVNGAPSPVRHRDELFYLEIALATGAGSGGAVTSHQVTPGELQRTTLNAHDVAILCNVGTLPAGVMGALTRFVERGGGLLVAVGGNVEPGRFNATVGRVLGVELRGAMTAAPPGSGAPALRLGRVDSAHPLLAPIWTAARGAGLRSARFRRVYRLKPDTTGKRRTVLWYDDGAPALVETRRGEGRMLLFTSTLDRDWNDLPIRPGYLPLVQQMARYLSRGDIDPPRRAVLVGAEAELPVPRGMTQLRLTHPDGREQLWTRRQLAGKRAVTVRVSLPGLHVLAGAPGAGAAALQTLERESFVANVDPRESDLRKARLEADGGRSAGGEAARARVRVELWHGVGALLLLLLLGEALITRRA